MRHTLVAAMLLAVGCGGTGPEGPPGPAGPEGAAGAKGDPGAGMSLGTDTLCRGQVVDGTSNALLFELDYSVWTFTDGSVMVECEVLGPSVEASHTGLYRRDQTGAGSGLCAVAYDPSAPYTFGFWSFELMTVGAQATYHEAGYVNDGKTFTLTCTRY